MTRIVDGLEALGFACREAHPDDSWAVLVTTTREISR